MNSATDKRYIPLSIISPVYNNGQELEGLLNSLKDDFKRNSFLEMIVVDDCSTNDSVAKTIERFSFVRYIRLAQNKGAAAARNAGARVAKNNVLVFIDSDVQVEKDAIGRIEEVMQDAGFIVEDRKIKLTKLKTKIESFEKQIHETKNGRTRKNLF